MPQELRCIFICLISPAHPPALLHTQTTLMPMVKNTIIAITATLLAKDALCQVAITSAVPARNLRDPI